MTHFRIFFTTVIFMLASCLTAWAGPFTLVIDAGHGGKDPGAVGATAKEKTINLNVALALGKMIENNCPDVKVIYTRKTDVFVSLQERANIANRAKANLFISIHTNSAETSAASGAETYTLGMHRAADNLAVAKRENGVITMESNYKQNYQGFDPNKAESYIIFELMQDKHMVQSVKLAQAIQKQYKGNGRKDKGVHQAGFLVLRETSMPSILTELGFISNPSEEAFLSSTDGVNKLASSIYEGFRSYRKMLASNDEATPSADASLLAMGNENSLHNTEGATSAVPEDVVPTIRPVKVTPYPTPAKKDSDTETTTEAPKQKPEEPVQKAEEPKQKPEEPVQKAEEPKLKPEEPVQKAEEPKQKPEEPVQKAEEPKQKPEEPVQKAEEPKQKPEEPVQKPEEPKQKPEEPVQKPEEPKQKPEEPKKEEPAKKAEEPVAAIPTGKPEFRIQIFSSKTLHKEGAPALKGLPVDYYMDGDTYKYTYGKSANYNDVVKLKQTIADKFPGLFIVAIVDGKRIDLQEAIQQSK